MQYRKLIIAFDPLWLLAIKQLKTNSENNNKPNYKIAKTLIKSILSCGIFQSYKHAKPTKS